MPACLQTIHRTAHQDTNLYIIQDPFIQDTVEVCAIPKFKEDLVLFNPEPMIPIIGLKTSVDL